VPRHRFAIAIPAHDEGTVISNTVIHLLKLNYPIELFQIFIVADHCSDDTADLARKAGAIAYERNEGPRTGKGGALAWLIERIFEEHTCDAVVVFDADTKVDTDFLRVMDQRLTQGSQVIQGKHVIINPDRGWFPSLTWAMFTIDNRYQNLGRTNMGLSAKLMGDSICFRVEILKKMGWGQGLTEDYQLRQRLLLEGIKVEYEPGAIGYGEAPRTWLQAMAQRSRWLRGTSESSRRYRLDMLNEGIRRKDPALIDGALQSFLPSYSTVTLLIVVGFVIHLSLYLLSKNSSLLISAGLVLVWGLLAMVLFFYPFLGLALERAPVRAYLVILSGPWFIVWRTFLALFSRFMNKPSIWVRTAHGEPK
jgi:cellulose synthase/poly-beta-1,6-N-acetylglucosamine synthase-like glycosyltransferase